MTIGLVSAIVELSHGKSPRPADDGMELISMGQITGHELGLDVMRSLGLLFGVFCRIYVSFGLALVVL